MSGCYSCESASLLEGGMIMSFINDMYYYNKQFLNVITFFILCEKNPLLCKAEAKLMC